MQEMKETQVWSLGQEDPLEEGMATHSSVLAWRIPWIEKPGGLQSIGSQRIKQNWSNLAHRHTYLLLMNFWDFVCLRKSLFLLYFRKIILLRLEFSIGRYFFKHFKCFTLRPSFPPSFWWEVWYNLSLLLLQIRWFSWLFSVFSLCLQFSAVWLWCR